MGFSNPNSAQATFSAIKARDFLRDPRSNLTWQNKNDSVRKVSEHKAIIRLYATDIATVVYRPDNGNEFAVTFNINGYYNTTTFARIKNIAWILLDATLSYEGPMKEGIWFLGRELLEDHEQYDFGNCRQQANREAGFTRTGIRMRWELKPDNTLRLCYNNEVIDIFDDCTTHQHCGSKQSLALRRAQQPRFATMHKNMLACIPDDALRMPALEAITNYLATGK